MTSGVFTNEVYQNELEGADLEYDATKHQPYFEFDMDGKKCLIGLDKILECMAIAVKLEELPQPNIEFWQTVAEKFHVDYYGYNITE